MALQIWLPLNGDLHNQGLNNIMVTNSNATLNNNGKIGQCYYFNGSSSRISFPAITITYPVSVCAWIKGETITASGTEYIISYNTATGGTVGHNIGFGTYQGKLTIWHGGSTASYNTALTNNVWYHIAAVVTESSYKLYLNGTEILSGSGTQSNKNSQFITLGARSNSSTGGVGAALYFFKGYMNDARIYDHALSSKEVEEISRGLILHYKLDESNINLAMTSADYNNKTHNTTVNATGWGGDTGTCTFYHYGGYNNLPYKVYHKLTIGSGGIYFKTANDIALEANTTYTMSCWIKGSRNFTASNYSFCINRGADNHYITYGTSFTITTNWQFFKKTFTTTSEENGLYGEMSIIYDDQVADYYVYYSGFKLEKGASATAWTPPNFNTREKIYDCSGYQNNGTIVGILSAAAGSPRYQIATQFPGNGNSIKVTPFYFDSQNWSVSLWYYNPTAATSTWESFLCLSKGDGTDANKKIALLFNNGYANNIWCKVNSGSARTIPIKVNEWTHLTLTSEGKLYENGILKTSSISPGANITGAYDLVLGARASAAGITSTTLQYSGKLSDVRVYSTALSAAAVQELYKTSMLVDASGNITAREVS